MSKIIIFSDFNFMGSGYEKIMSPVCLGLHNAGHELMVVGLGYGGQEHPFPYPIIPSQNFQSSHAMINNLKHQWGAEILVVAIDIPYQAGFIAGAKKLGMKVISVVPLENPPLTPSWAQMLQQSDKVFFISQLGEDEGKKAGLENCEHLVVGIDTNFWRLRTEEEYKQGRALFNFSEDTLVVLTVADNQERKNLSKAMEIVSKVKHEHNIKVKYILITREHSEVGWKLRDLAMYYKIASDVIILDRNLPIQKLFAMYCLADVFLLTSKAEGLCVLPDTRVWTEKGLKNIQDLEVDDWVVTHDGSLQRISETFERDVEEKINVLDMGFGLEPIKVTQNHPILSVSNLGRKNIFGKSIRQLSSLAYKEAKELKKGDYVFYPKPKTYITDEILIANHIKDTMVDSEDNVRYITRNQTGESYMGKHTGLKDIQIIDKDFCTLLGWYVAEGYDTKEGLSFSLHSDEVEYREIIRRILKEKFNLQLHDTFRERNRYDGRVYCRALGSLFSNLCGDNAHNKHLPNWALFLDEEKTWAILEALFSGDGSFDKNSGTLRYSTISKELSRQIQFLLFRVGIVSAVRDSKIRLEYTVTVSRPEIFNIPFLKNENIYQPNKVQRQFIELEDGWLLPIRENKLEEYAGKVYNIEVENNHSYLLAGGVVHNCLPVMEAMCVGIPVVATDTGAITELLGKNERGFLIETEYSHIDPWGNSLRIFPRAEHGSAWLKRVADKYEQGGIDATVEDAREYMETRTFDKPIGQMLKVVEELINVQE